MLVEEENNKHKNKMYSEGAWLFVNDIGLSVLGLEEGPRALKRESQRERLEGYPSISPADFLNFCPLLRHFLVLLDCTALPDEHTLQRYVVEQKERAISKEKIGPRHSAVSIRSVTRRIITFSLGKRVLFSVFFPH